MEIYTDTSAGKKYFGFGIMFDNEQTEKKYSFALTIPEMILKYNIPNNIGVKIPENSNLGESIAIFESLEILKRYYKKEKVVLYTDSLIFFETFYNINKTKDKLFNIFIKRCRRIIRDKNLQVEIRWIKGHVDVYGNEISNKLARKSYLKIKNKYQQEKVRQKRIKNHRKLLKSIKNKVKITETEQKILNILKDEKNHEKRFRIIGHYIRYQYHTG